jgi:hypothetical protein
VRGRFWREAAIRNLGELAIEDLARLVVQHIFNTANLSY